MWIVPYLIETRSKAAWLTLAVHRVRRLLRPMVATLAAWRRREREREELCRYTAHEFRDLPSELRISARFECRKRFWES